VAWEEWEPQLSPLPPLLPPMKKQARKYRYSLMFIVLKSAFKLYLPGCRLEFTNYNTYQDKSI
jgi:hypothetical protein